MSANPIWIAGYFGPVAGAAPVWIAPGDGTVPSAVQSQIVSYYAPVAGATAVWIAGFFAPPPAAIGATPITISGWGGSGGGGGGHSAEALAYLARTVGGDEGGNGANIATLIDGLVSDGVWAKLDALYVLAQQNQTDAMLNLVGTSYGLTSGLLRPGPRALTFAPYVGFSGFVSGLDTGFNPTTAPSPHYVQNSASYGVWVYAFAAGNSFPIGAIYPNTVMYDNLGGTFYVSVNGLGVATGIPSTITKGLLAGDRASATAVVPYQSGVAGASDVQTSAAISNNSFLIGYAHGGVGNPSTNTLSAAFIGASLGAAGQLALYNRLRTYMSSVGVP